MNRLISFFDYSTIWGQPFADRGWDVWPWDVKHDKGMDINLLTDCEATLEQFDSVDGILAAPPCTHMAVSGAQYWPAKDKDGRTAEGMELISQVLRIVDLFTPTDLDWYEEAEQAGLSWFWALENPVGRIQKLFPWLDPPMYFNPCDYAGYLNLTDHDHNELDRIRRKDGRDINREEIDFVVRCEAYTKKTGLWGDFCHNLPTKPIEPVRVCRQGSPVQIYGGASERTKELRSYTPRGFAEAFAIANEHYIGKNSIN